MYYFIKNLYALRIIIFLSIGCFATKGISQIDSTIHNFVLYDNKGNLIPWEDWEIKNANNTGLPPAQQPILCSNDYFEIDFYGIVSSSTIDIARRNVICQVFDDLANYIDAPKMLSSADKITIQVVANNTLGSPFAAATPGFLIPAFNTNGGIATNTITQFLNTGINPYNLVPTPSNSASFYHGTMEFSNTVSWNTDLSIPATNLQNDLYTVILHEALHVLGFTSFITENGQSIFSNYYSDYDLHLFSGTNKLLRQSNACTGSQYNYTFNSVNVPISVLNPCIAGTNYTTNTTNCSDAIEYRGRTIVPVYTPECFEFGSSLSHFEDECYPSGNPAGGDTYFVMANSYNVGATRRSITEEEHAVMCDLGYSVQNTFGSTNANNVVTFNSGSCSNGTLYGLSDGLDLINGNFLFTGTSGSDIFTTDLIANDVGGVTDISCLEVILGNGTITRIDPTTQLADPNGTAIKYSGSTITGFNYIRYTPKNSSKAGNITYVTIYVAADQSCVVPDPCNLVQNGDFEQYVSIPQYLGEINKACGWLDANSWAAYFHRNSPAQIDVPCNLYAYEEDLKGGDGYAGIPRMLSGSSLPRLGMMYSALSTPLIAGQEYQFSIDISQTERDSRKALPLEVYFSEDLTFIPYTSGSPIQVSNPNLLFELETVGEAKGWSRRTFKFIANGNEQFLVLGHLSGLPVQTNTPATVPIACPTVNINVNVFDHWQYVDNLSLIEAPSINDIVGLESSYCVDHSPVLLTGVTPGGNFVGYGTSGNNFDPALAGVGNYTVSYESFDGVGCLSALTVKNVNVTDQLTFEDIPDIYCQTEDPVELNATPSGGTFSGAGVSGSTFNPGLAPIGQNTIEYTFNNANSACNGTLDQTVQVNGFQCCLPTYQQTSMGSTGSKLTLTTNTTFNKRAEIYGMIILDGITLTLDPGAALIMKGDPSLWILPSATNIGYFNGFYLKNGAKIVLNGATIAGDCDGPGIWYGIASDGNPNNEFRSSGGILNGTFIRSTVAHMRYGIRLDYGKFYVEETNFQNNVISLNIAKSLISNGSPNEYVRKCLFTASAEDWRFSGPPYASTHIQLFGSTGQNLSIGESQPSSGNIFENCFYGIWSGEAMSFNIRRNTFRNFILEGIYQWGWAGYESQLRDNTFEFPTSIPAISEGPFVPLANNAQLGTQVFGANIGNANMRDNIFIGTQDGTKPFEQRGVTYVPGIGSYQYAQNGALITNPHTAAIVRENTFSNLNQGIALRGGGTAIGEIKENVFTDCEYAIYAFPTSFGAPSNEIQCNTFTNDQWNTGYGIYVAPGGKMNDLGACSNPNGNHFISSKSMITVDNNGSTSLIYSGYSNEALSGNNLSFNNITPFFCQLASTPGSCGDAGIPISSGGNGNTNGGGHVKKPINAIKSIIDRLLSQPGQYEEEENRLIGLTVQLFARSKKDLVETELERLRPMNERAFSLLTNALADSYARNHEIQKSMNCYAKVEASPIDELKHAAQMMRIHTYVDGRATGTHYELTNQDILDLQEVAASSTPFYNQKACALLNLKGLGCTGFGTSSSGSRIIRQTGRKDSEALSNLVQLKISPNPAGERIQFTVIPETFHKEHKVHSEFSLSIYDLNGTLLLTHAFPLEETQWVLQSYNLGTGVFIVALNEANHILDRQKLVILK